jgi:uncharacterized protein (TIGR04255 family)
MAENFEFPVLSKNPIEAAIFELRHLFITPAFSINELSGFHNLIKDKFPTMNKGYNRNIHVQELPNGKAKATVTNNEINELRFIASDQTRILSINSRVFNLNIPGNYTNWSDYYSDFEYLYRKFYEYLVTKIPHVLVGASVRYINKFRFENFEDPSEYFNTTIYAVKQAVPDSVTSYTMKYVVEQEKPHIQIHVTQGADPVVDKIVPYLFDIDVIYNHNLQMNEVKGIYEQLYYLKNKTFFYNLTDKTINLFK